MLTTVIFILHNRNPETQKPRNRVSFRDTTVILGNHNRNPVSFAPRKNSQKPGFLESDRQLSLFSTTETRFLSSQATNPRNRTQKPGFFYAYHSYLYSPPKKPGFFPPSNKPQKLGFFTKQQETNMAYDRPKREQQNKIWKTFVPF